MPTVQLRVRDLLLVVAIIAGGCGLAQAGAVPLVIYAMVVAPLMVRWLPNPFLRAAGAGLISWTIASVVILLIFQALTDPEDFDWREDLIEAMGKGSIPGTISAVGSFALDGAVLLWKRSKR